MYQRLAMGLPAVSGADAEDEGDGDAEDRVRSRKEDAGKRDHHEHHDGGDHHLAPGRPRDLLGLGANLLQELLRTDHRCCLALRLEGLASSGYAAGPSASPVGPATSPIFIY